MRSDDDEPLGDGHDNDYWDDDALDDDTAEVMPCPECGAEIYEDAEQCPVCGCYVTFGTSPWSGRSPIWIVLGIAGIVAVIFVLSFLG
jgi:hypothetical protein